LFHYPVGGKLIAQKRNSTQVLSKPHDLRYHS